MNSTAATLLCDLDRRASVREHVKPVSFFNIFCSIFNVVILLNSQSFHSYRPSGPETIPARFLILVLALGNQGTAAEKKIKINNNNNNSNKSNNNSNIKKEYYGRTANQLMGKIFPTSSRTGRRATRN